MAPSYLNTGIGGYFERFGFYASSDLPRTQKQLVSALTAVSWVLTHDI